MFKKLKVNTEKEWLTLRSKVITATDASVILGLNPYSSVAKMLEDKKNPIPINNSYITIGRLLEPLIVKETNIVLDKQFKLFEDNEGKTFFINEDINLGATPDAYDGNIILECKSTNPVNYIKWYNWPPSYYLMQLYTQLVCTDNNKGLLAISSTDLTQKSIDLNLPIIIFSIQRTKELDNILFSEVKRFWESVSNNKKYRVNRTQTKEIEMRLRFITTKIH